MFDIFHEMYIVIKINIYYWL